MENVIWGLVGVLVGSILTALITLINSRQQLTHEKEKERLNRLIRAREAYLIPLRETIAEWIRYSRLTAIRMVFVGEEGLPKRDPKLYKTLYDDFVSISNREEELLLKLNVLLSQVSDVNLYEQIELLKKQAEQANISILPMIALLSKLKAKIQLDQLDEIKNQCNISMDQIHKLLIPINQRIETLLSDQ